MGKRYTKDEFINLLNEKTNNIKLVGDYCGIFSLTDFQCNKKHTFSAIPHNILDRLSCPVCSGKRIVIGVNDLWTVRPDVAKLLVNKDKGYVYGVGSHQKESFTCPKCHKISDKTISKVVSRGFSCDYCSDGISFPNKMLRYILDNLCVDNIYFEWSPSWLKPRKYDGYFELKNKSYVVEMDGGIGHGYKGFYDNNNNGLKIDQEKDNLASQHKIEVIRIDCNYTDVETRFEYIKTNLLKSKLSQIVNLSSILWDECLQFALSSNIVKAAELYNEQYHIEDIARNLKCSRCTVRGWLKQASKINLCDYSPDTVRYHGCRKLPSNIVNIEQVDFEGNIIETFISVAEAHRKTGINNISTVLNGKQKSAGGFLWRKCSTNNTK
jgi:AraC-like DNA-binding protein